MTLRGGLACTWALALLIVGAPLHAQGVGDSTSRPLVRQLQQRVAEIVQRSLHASDDQMRQLLVVNRRYETEWRSLAQRDRESRAVIRAEVLRDTLADQHEVARNIEVLIDVQRQRLDLLSREQKDLAEFLTPVQRAQYMTLQARLRKKVEDLRERRQNGGPLAPDRRRMRELGRPGRPGRL